MKRRIDTIVIHCSATRENQDYTFEDCVRDHKARGFKKCGYHFFIRKDGTVHVGRALSEVGAHAGKKYNPKSVGICYEGGLDAANKPKDTRTPVQRTAILNCILEAMHYAPSITQIVGHRDLSPDLNGNGQVEPSEWIKSCPCFDAIPEYKHLVA